jgi:hypothetical protein
MIFYMAVRYEGEGSEPDLELTNTFLTQTDKSPLQARFNTLLHWNRIDSVSNWERNRNNIIDSFYQHNRNPFIDHPELVEYLWGDSLGATWMAELSDTSIGASMLEFSTREVRITNDYVSTNLIKLDLEVPEGLYFLQLESNGEVITKMIIKE